MWRDRHPTLQSYRDQLCSRNHPLVAPIALSVGQPQWLLLMISAVSLQQFHHQNSTTGMCVTGSSSEVREEFSNRFTQYPEACLNMIGIRSAKSWGEICGTSFQGTILALIFKNNVIWTMTAFNRLRREVRTSPALPKSLSMPPAEEGSPNI